VVKDLLNPSGTIQYARYKILDGIDIDSQNIVFDTFSRQIAGTVNVASESSFVWGTNTYFEVANTIGLLSEGTYILVNSEIRIVNSIINNTLITVSESYESDANDQLATIIVSKYNENPVVEQEYDAITTEYWRELASVNDDRSRTIVIRTERDFDI